MKGAALLLVLGCAGSGAIDAGPGRWKVDVTLSLVEKEGTWFFRIDGTTDLPAGTVLNSRIFVVEERNDPFAGPVEDDGEPLVGRDDAFQSASHAFRVEGAEIHERVHGFRRKPYSLAYRVKVTYAPEDQSDALTLKVGDEPFAHQADLRVGTEADLAAELRERVKDMGQDLVSLDLLATELSGWIGRTAAHGDAWTAWRDAAVTRIDELQTRNLSRYSVWAVWAEYQGRMRIDGLSGFLERMITALDGPKPDVKQIRLWMSGFVGSIDEAYTTIGYEPPLDVRQAGPVIAAYEAAVKPVLEGRVELVRKARADGVGALYDMLALLRSRPRGYLYVNAVGLQLVQLLDLLRDRASDAQLKDAMVRHEAALRDLRRFAGLP